MCDKKLSKQGWRGGANMLFTSITGFLIALAAGCTTDRLPPNGEANAISIEARFLDIQGDPISVHDRLKNSSLTLGVIACRSAFTPNIQGDIDINQLPKSPIIGPRPRTNEAAMLLWSYNLQIYLDASPQEFSAEVPVFKTVRVFGFTYMPPEALDLLAQ